MNAAIAAPRKDALVRDRQHLQHRLNRCRVALDNLNRVSFELSALIRQSSTTLQASRHISTAQTALTEEIIWLDGELLRVQDLIDAN